MTQNNIRKVLEKHPLIPVVNFQSLAEIDGIMDILRKQSISVIEITLRSPISFEAIRLCKEKYGKEFCIGVGTITCKEQIMQCIDLMVDFLVSPGSSNELKAHFDQSGIAFIPGVATPSDIIEGINQGWDTFKFFPATLFGGVDALKTYAQVFPNVLFCPTGGINKSSHADYLRLENVISVGGSWMTKKEN